VAKVRSADCHSSAGNRPSTKGTNFKPAAFAAFAAKCAWVADSAIRGDQTYSKLPWSTSDRRVWVSNFTSLKHALAGVFIAWIAMKIIAKKELLQMTI
jgi:hypothetical protein